MLAISPNGLDCWPVFLKNMFLALLLAYCLLQFCCSAKGSKERVAVFNRRSFTLLHIYICKQSCIYTLFKKGVQSSFVFTPKKIE